jgi:hypothetical protein
VAEAGEDVHALRLRGGLEQGPAVGERRDLVAFAVEDEQRGVELVDAAQVRVGVGDEGRWDDRVVQAAEFADGCERGEQYEPGGRALEREQAVGEAYGVPRSRRSR